GVGRADRLLVVLQPVPVPFRVAESKGIGRAQLPVELHVLLVVEKHPKPLGSREPEVIAAFGTDLEVAGQLLVVEDLPAVLALDPEPFRHLARTPLPQLLRRLVLLEPHGNGNANRDSGPRIEHRGLESLTAGRDSLRRLPLESSVPRTIDSRAL